MTTAKKKPQNVLSDHAYKVLMAAAVGLLVVGTIVYHSIEDWSWVDSIYFSTVTVTTVGFGDLVPTSDASKMFTVVYTLSGITIITTFLNQRFKQRAIHRVKNVPE